MNKRVWILPFAAVVCLQANAAQMPPNSFLVRSANSTEEFVTQIRKYPQVSDRFERHYGMTQREVIEYVRGLRLTRLEKGGLYSVYNVPASSGVLRARAQNLKAGTRVWVDFTGQPVMMWICGNPMSRGPKEVADSGKVAANVIGVASDEMVAMTPAQAVNADGPIFVSSLEPDVPMVDLVPEVAPEVNSRGNNLGGLLLLPIGAAFIGNRRGGGDDIPPVPEPITMVTLGAGIAAVAARRRKSN